MDNKQLQQAVSINTQEMLKRQQERHELYAAQTKADQWKALQNAATRRGLALLQPAMSVTELKQAMREMIQLLDGKDYKYKWCNSADD